MKTIHGIGIPTQYQEDDNTNSSVIGVVLIANSEPDSKLFHENSSDIIVVIPGLITPGIVNKYSFARVFVAERGSWSSHGVSLARAKGISCLVGVGEEICYLQNGLRVKVDIMEGTLSFITD